MTCVLTCNNFSQTSKFAQKYIVFMGCSGHWELKPKYLRRFTIVEFFRDLFIFLSKWLHRWEATSSLGPSHKLLLCALPLMAFMFILPSLGWLRRKQACLNMTLLSPGRAWGGFRRDEEGRFTIKHFCMSQTRSLLTSSGWPVTLQECRETEKCDSSSRHRLKKTCRHMHLNLYRQIDNMWCFKESSG